MKKQGITDTVVRMQRPELISKRQWPGIKAYLVAISLHYPRPYPSQETLALEMGCDVRSIQRYQRVSEACGLLQVTPDAGRRRDRSSWSKTHRYHIVKPDQLSGMQPDSSSGKGSFGTSYEVPQSQASPFSSRKARNRRAAPAEMASREEPSRQVGEDQPPLSAKTRRRVVKKGKQQQKPPPGPQPHWRRLANEFVQGWQDMVETTAADDRLRSIRPLDSLGGCKNYLDAHFLGPEALTPKEPEEIAAMMSSFHTGVRHGEVTIKDGQSAWLCFTGAWGRKRRSFAADAKHVDDYFDKEHKP